jgi:hypothetical protein
MAAFEYRNAEQLGKVFKRHGVMYLFFGKSGAILLGFADTTQDVDLYVEKGRDNCEKALAAVLELGFHLTDEQQQEIRSGRMALIQLRNGPFDLDLVFAPDGIGRFEDAWRRHVVRDVCWFSVKWKAGALR